MKDRVQARHNIKEKMTTADERGCSHDMQLFLSTLSLFDLFLVLFSLARCLLALLYRCTPAGKN